MLRAIYQPLTFRRLTIMLSVRLLLRVFMPLASWPHGEHGCCLLYTSDAADERSSVDLGGRRIIKKKTTQNKCVEENDVRVIKYRR